MRGGLSVLVADISVSLLSTVVAQRSRRKNGSRGCAGAFRMRASTACAPSGPPAAGAWHINDRADPVLAVPDEQPVPTCARIRTSLPPAWRGDARYPPAGPARARRGGAP